MSDVSPYLASLPVSAAVSRADAFCPSLGQVLSDGEPVVPSIVQSTTFARDGIGSNALHQYSRCSNPTVVSLETALGALESAPPAVAFSTGLAAETALFLSLVKAGDHVVCGTSVYGGTTRLLRAILEPLGVSSTFVDATDPQAVARAVTPATKLIFAETPANPSLELTDIAALSAIAKPRGITLVIDNTFLTPVLQQPLDLGADVCVYSTTKFIEGHSAALGGALVARDAALLERFRFLRKCTGAIQTPLGAYLTLQGLRTLPLRIRHQSRTAEAIANKLAEHPAVVRVNYPTLAGARAAKIASRQHLGAHGAVVSFELENLDTAKRFALAVKAARLVEHVGSVETLLTHPATMTHADVPQDQRLLAGITDGLLRLSVGLEPAELLIPDLLRALDEASARPKRREASLPASNLEARACPAIA